MRSLVPAFLVLLLSVLATGIAAKAVHREVSSVELRQFQTEADAVKEAIAESMRSHELASHAGAGLFSAVPDVSGEQWRKFVADRAATFWWTGILRMMPVVLI